MPTQDVYVVEEWWEEDFSDDLDTMSDYESQLDAEGISDGEEGFIRGFLDAA